MGQMCHRTTALSDFAARLLLADLGLPNAALSRDTLRARAMLQEIFGDIRLVEDGNELYAEFETPLERVVFSVGGALPGRVAGAGFEPATFGL